MYAEQFLQGGHSGGEEFSRSVRVKSQGDSFMEYYIIEQSVGCVGRIATFHRSEHQVPRREINDAQDIVIPMLVLFDRIVISSVRCTGFYTQFSSEVLMSMFLAGFEEVAQGALRYHAKACVVHMLKVKFVL